jgi:hypothetical protein
VPVGGDGEAQRHGSATAGNERRHQVHPGTRTKPPRYGYGSGATWQPAWGSSLVAPLFAAETPLWLTILGVLAIPALVALNGFFVAAEFALVAVRRTRVEELVSQGVPRAKSVEQAVTHLDRTIAATQLGITIASIALGWVGEVTLASAMQPWFTFLPETQAIITRTHWPWPSRSAWSPSCTSSSVN